MSGSSATSAITPFFFQAPVPIGTNHRKEIPMTHVNLAFIRSKTGRADELGQALKALIEPSRAEDGCISYDIFRSKDDSELWMAFEEWQSPEHLDAHFQQPHMQAFVSQVPVLIEGDLDLRAFSRA